MNIIRITDEYSLKKGKCGFTLQFTASESYIGEKGKLKGKEVHESYDKYYGVLYQALQGFVDDYVGRYSDSIDDIMVKVKEATEAIGELKSVIPESWKVVKVVRG